MWSAQQRSGTWERRSRPFAALAPTLAATSIARRKAGLSQHASANAIDIASFTFADGSRITLLQDWNDADAKGRFLREVRNGACPIFGAVLSLDYNAAHRNHFHFDMGPGKVCRCG